MFLETFESWTERIHLANQLISLGFLLRLFFARQLILFSGIKPLVEGLGIEVEHLHTIVHLAGRLSASPALKHEF